MRTFTARPGVSTFIVLVLGLVAFWGAKHLFANDQGALEKSETKAVQAEYVWFPVSGNQTDCTAATPDLKLYPTSEFEEVEEILASEPPISCPTGPYCCAKGYAANRMQREVIDGVEYWVPVSAVADAERKRS